MLFSLCDIAVFRRASIEGGAPPPDSLLQNGSIEVIDFACEVSSTDIRELIAAGQSVSEFLPPRVNRYIREHDLYLHS